MIFAPLIILVALAVRISGPGVVYRHRRIGAKGEPFDCLKFRTMVPDSEDLLAELLAADPEHAAEFARSAKLRYDPRVTRVGRVLRATSLDELPQLFCVLRGRMSLVGPRPVTEGEVARYGALSRQYLGLRPGITGLWQVSGRNRLSFTQRIALDYRYHRDLSFLTDVRILARTVLVCFHRDGAW